MNTKLKRSPLKEPPLRQAGQSVDEEIQRIWGEETAPYYFVAFFVIVLAAYDWWRWYSNSPPRPWITTILALGFTAFFLRRFFIARRRIRTLRQARDGERTVGQLLEDLRAQGYKVLHDIIGEGFNIDHLLVGPQGIFTIETKTWSKPLRGKTEIQYDGEQLLVAGLRPDRDPIIQAKAQAGWIKTLLKEMTGQSYYVRPVVIYCGWFIKRNPPGLRPEVWVLNEKALPSFIDHENVVLRGEQIHSVNDSLSRYVRNH